MCRVFAVAGLRPRLPRHHSSPGCHCLSRSLVGFLVSAAALILSLPPGLLPSRIPSGCRSDLSKCVLEKPFPGFLVKAHCVAWRGVASTPVPSIVPDHASCWGCFLLKGLCVFCCLQGTPFLLCLVDTCPADLSAGLL